jgi:hypothetical protein
LAGGRFFLGGRGGALAVDVNSGRADPHSLHVRVLAGMDSPHTRHVGIGLLL